MADYWKSQPKKFCTYCKCWIADNKPSIEFHERGKNHKENVANKITEIKQKSMEKAKQEAKATKEFEAMEEAALKAYQEDLKRLGVDPVPEHPIATPSIQREPKVKKKMEPQRVRNPPVRTDEWVKGVSSEGYPYYYNAATGESRWEKPDSNEESTEDVMKTGETSVWVEAFTEDGHTYYYNAVTRESRWEKPEDFVPVNDNLHHDSISATDMVSGECSAIVLKEEECTAIASEEEESTAVEEESTAVALKESESAIEESTKQELGAVETEFAAEPPKKQEEVAVEIPARSDEVTETEPELETSDGAQEQPAPVLVEKQIRTARKPTAYGTWEEIKEEEDPYENVDLELPNVEYDCPPVTELNVPQEPKVKFKEKTITCLGDAAAIGSPVFKKRKTENGKSRNIRQRIDDT